VDLEFRVLVATNFSGHICGVSPVLIMHGTPDGSTVYHLQATIGAVSHMECFLRHIYAIAKSN
jgi:hypothetical protein